MESIYTSMKKPILLGLLLSSWMTSIVMAQNGIPRPKLTVGIVVDQMRYDYLYRFYDNFGEGGFKRLMKGANFHNTFISHLPAFTAPGHAAIYTGSVPALNGIVANDWIDNNSMKKVYCVEDKSVKSVGSVSDAGQMSPRNLIASTITDEFVLATNHKSRSFGISIKDRGAILPGGHLGQAYWYDSEIGGFITSSFYRDKAPDWLTKFNDSKPVDRYFADDWFLYLAASKYSASRIDSNVYEGFYKQGGNTFPHKLSHFRGMENDAIKVTPFGNTLSIDFAKLLIREEKLGMDQPDFLALSLSSTDYIGHVFGPQSMEIEDTYIRLDRDLSRFFGFLDSLYGDQAYTVFLTADHGAAHNALYLKDLGMHAGEFWEKEEKEYLFGQLDRKFGGHDFFRDVINYAIYLDESKMGEVDPEDVRAFIVDLYSRDERMTFALDMHEPEDWMLPSPIREMVHNHFYSKRCGDVLLIPSPQYYAAYYTTGTVHGTWNPYDTHIPFLMYGMGVAEGRDIYEQTYMMDIAPTISNLLKIQVPNACIGKSKYQLIK